MPFFTSRVTNLYPLQYLLMQIQNNMDYIVSQLGCQDNLQLPYQKKQVVWPWS